MNTDTIGMNAGLVWNALNDAQAMGLKQLKKDILIKDLMQYLITLNCLNTQD